MIQVAHIYPFHSISHLEADEYGPRHIFWNLLKIFWPPEKTAAWEAELFPAGLCELGAERVCNLITLSPHAHFLWARGAFALKPISHDTTSLKLQFFWQKKQQEAPRAMNLTTTPFSTEGLTQNADVLDHAARLYKEGGEGEAALPLRSGDSFTLRIDDPERKPLPSFQLLELQWFLQRVMGMAGTADVYWPSLSEVSSDTSGVELGEEGFDSPDPDLEFDGVEEL